MHGRNARLFSGFRRFGDSSNHSVFAISQVIFRQTFSSPRAGKMTPSAEGFDRIHRHMKSVCNRPIALALTAQDGNFLLFQIRHSYQSNLKELSFSALRTVGAALFRFPNKKSWGPARRQNPIYVYPPFSLGNPISSSSGSVRSLLKIPVNNSGSGSSPFSLNRIASLRILFHSTETL